MSFETVLIKIAEENSSGNLHLLIDLVSAIRPKKFDDAEQARKNILALCHYLVRHIELKEALKRYLAETLSSRKLLHALVNDRMYQAHTLWSDFFERLGQKILPLVPDENNFQDVLGLVFHRKKDSIWVDQVADDDWRDLFQIIGFDSSIYSQEQKLLVEETLSAIKYLSYQIAGVGLQPEFVKNYPNIEEFESPFSRQNEEAVEYVQNFEKLLYDPSLTRVDARQIEVLLDQCELIANKVEGSAAFNGVSVGLTRLLHSLKHSIDRMRHLLSILETPISDDFVILLVQLFKQTIKDEKSKNSIAMLWRSNTQLLSKQVTQCAGQSGEHYVTSTRQEWFAMGRSSLKAGFFVAFMALFKSLTGKLMLAPIGFALLHAFNYSFGFMLIHIVHGTLATKQPAMTASLLARSFERSKVKLHHLVELIVDILRSQFIAIMGNIALAFPTAILIAWVWERVTGDYLLGDVKAHKTLEELNLTNPSTLIYAAIAGVCLFASGLISGYYDNKAKYNHISARLARWSLLNKLLGQARSHRVAHYIDSNLGALAGNFFLGLMLAFVAPIGGFLGLPIDIRHVTLSSANLGLALYDLSFNISWQQASWVISGVLMIGVVNLTVSFSLALWVALTSKGGDSFKEMTLTKLMFHRFLSRPKDFFIPPKESSLSINDQESHKFK